MVSTTSEDPRKLLDEFISSTQKDQRKREQAFLKLVHYYSPLIHASAMRRTGHSHLAEEITQSVLTLLARKAASLLKHPTLTGWVFQTTRLEAAKALRSEARRASKHQDLARQPQHHPDMNLDSHWKELLPRLDQCLDKLPESQREVILLYYFERKKHREIATARQISVSASKMQLKRGLEHLSKLLGRPNLNLPMATLTTGLASHLATAPPATAAPLLTAKALTLAPKLSHSAVASNTLLTMSLTKKSILTACLIIGIISVPTLHQARTNQQLRHDLAQIERQQQSMARSSTRSQREHTPPRQTVRNLFQSDSKNFDMETFLTELAAGQKTSNVSRTLRALLPVAAMSKEEVEELIKDIQKSDAKIADKIIALQTLGMIASSIRESDPIQVLEKLVAVNANPDEYFRILDKWARKDPEAALDWLRNKDQESELFAGMIPSYHRRQFLKAIIRPMAGKKPERAIALYLDETDSNTRRALLQPLTLSLLDAGDHPRLLEVIHAESNPSNKLQFIKLAAFQIARKQKDPDAALAFVNQTPAHPDRYQALQAIIEVSKGLTFSQRMDWLRQHSSEEHTTVAVFDLMWQSYQGRSQAPKQSDAQAWLRAQPPGPLRDSAHSAIVQWHLRKSQFLEAYNHAGSIQDRQQKEQVLNWVSSSWKKARPEEAIEQLPAHLLK